MGIITDHFGFNYNFIGYGGLALLRWALLVWKVPDRTPSEILLHDAQSKPELPVGVLCESGCEGGCEGGCALVCRVWWDSVRVV